VLHNSVEAWHTRRVDKNLNSRIYKLVGELWRAVKRSLTKAEDAFSAVNEDFGIGSELIFGNDQKMTTPRTVALGPLRHCQHGDVRMHLILSRGIVSYYPALNNSFIY